LDTKLYVGNMSFDTTEEQLRELFSQAGTVVAVDVIKDRDSGRPKGFAFVTMGSQAEAEAAINMYNSKTIGGRPLTVNVARPREERPGGGGRGGDRGGRGGFGGGGGRGGGGGDRRGGNSRY
jgi:cold-inducible RNA-binding protein